MKLKIAAVYISVLVLTGCTTHIALMHLKDTDGTKMLVGTTTRSALLNDVAFSWFRKGYDGYKPTHSSIQAIAKQVPSLHIEVFGGTWCSDTRELLPKFYRTIDEAHIADAQISLHLVGRNKVAKDGSTTRFGISNVPIFIVLKEGKEIGRVVESTHRSIEADIADMLVDKD